MQAGEVRGRCASTCCATLLLSLVFVAPASATMVEWFLRQDPSTPGTRFWHSATYDPVRHLTVMFGGLRGSTAQGDTWGWDGNAWKLLAPARPGDPNWPSPRYAAAMTYYVKPAGDGDGILLFGGIDAANALLGDTFEWNGATKTWTKLATPTAPAPRSASAMAYHAGAQRVILFGGGDQSANGLSPADTWSWDGNQWSKLLSGLPPPRAGHALAYDDARQRIVLFGGFESFTDVLGDTWEFSGAGWHHMCIPNPCDTPPRFLHAMAYDRQQQQTVLFGGVDATGRQLDDTWLWDGKTWVGLYPSTPAAPARSGHVLTFDSTRNVSVLFAGRGAADLADTRESVFSGQPCEGNNQCDTGFCVDRVCCKTACTGICHRCDLPNPFVKATLGVSVIDGLCRIPEFQDPDHECANQPGCPGFCGVLGQCDFAGPDTSCGLCAACNPSTGKCDQLPSSGDDANCPPARCSLASHECRTFFDQSTNIKRCLEVGKCGWRWEDCNSFQDRDGAVCYTQPDRTQSSCSGGLCELP